MAKSEEAARSGGAPPVQARPVPVDADTIRGAYRAVLDGTDPLPAEPGLFAEQLTGHIRLLAGEIRVERMSGEWRATAEHVLARARQLADARTVPPASDVRRVWALATYCRALHSLYERAPLDGDAPAPGGGV